MAAYWLLTAGLVIMVSDLTIAGSDAGRDCGSQARPGSFRCRRRGRTGWCGRCRAIPLAAGFIALLCGITTGPRGAGSAVDRTAVSGRNQWRREASTRRRHRRRLGGHVSGAGRALGMAYVVASVAGVTFFVVVRDVARLLAQAGAGQRRRGRWARRSCSS